VLRNVHARTLCAKQAALRHARIGGITFFNENLFFFACFDETIGTLVDNDEGGHGNNEPMAKGSENDERGV
jgi:hypothetical protein